MDRESGFTNSTTKLLADVKKEGNDLSSFEMENAEIAMGLPDFSKLITSTPTVKDSLKYEDQKLVGMRNVVIQTVQTLKRLTKEENCSEYCACKTKLSGIVANLETLLPRSLGGSMKNLAKELDVECEERISESFRDLVIQKTEKPRFAMSSSSSDDAMQNVESDSKSAKNKGSGLRDYPPRKEEQSSKNAERCDELTSFLHGLSDRRDVKLLDELFHKQETRHAGEKKQVLDRCIELEKSLDLLKSEYEQCEDYWSAKLEEEREIFEQEQKISDEKLSELISKMTEYEEQFNSNDKMRSEGALTPIEEKVNLEEQYTDLEDEYESYKTRTEEEINEKDKEISELREKLGIKHSLRDVSLQYPEEQAQSLDSSTPFSYHSLESAGTYEIANIHNMFESSEEHKGSLETTRKKRREPSISSSECFEQIDTDISFDDVRWLIKKKADIGFECKALQKEKEKLRHEISKLRSVRQLNSFSTQPQFIDVNIVQNLYTKLHTQELRQKDFLACIRHQQQDTVRLLQQTWKQHLNEVTDLKLIIHNCKEQLEQQMHVNKEQAERLSRADLLTRELFVENTHLLDSVKRLEQHCHILSQCETECTSV